MDIEQQIQTLINEAPDPTTTLAVKAIAPLLQQLAGQLKHPEYYILQTLERGWLMTTLSNRQQPDTQKTVIYAYPSLLAAGAGQQDPQLMALPYPVTHLLFQMLSMKQVDSFIFLEEEGRQPQAAEIRRQDLEAMLQQQLHQLTQPPSEFA
jgi:hypothetical protein